MKNKDNYFFGKYYKFINNDGFSFAIIDADTVRGKVIQIVTEDRAYIIKENNQVKISENRIEFNVVQDNIKIGGFVTFHELHPLKKDVMGILRKLNIECKHNIYSMYHQVGGRLQINDKIYSFLNGYGYIEGDEGINFPKKYIWFNSINTDYGLTLAVAEIPFNKLIHFKGCFLTYKDNEYELVFSTLNRLRICRISKYLIILRKGCYVFKLYLDDAKGQKLYAPKQGEMQYFIHEAIRTMCGFEIFHRCKLLVSQYDVYGSLERVDL